MIYEFVSIQQESADSFIVTFNRQFRPNWFQRLLGYIDQDRYIRYIGFEKHWWDLSEGRKVPQPVWEQCNLAYRRFKDEQSKQIPTRR